MSNSKFQVRDLHKIDPEGENEGVHDILFTGADGVIRYSDDVYESAEEAQKAIAALEATGELPDWWEVFTPTPQTA